MDKQIIAQGLANKLWTAEETIDTAITDVSALMTEMVEARRAAGVSATLDAKASAKIIEAMAALSTARTAMVDAHHEMAEIKLRLGLRTKLFAAGEKGKPAGGGMEANLDREAV